MNSEKHTTTHHKECPTRTTLPFLLAILSLCMTNIYPVAFGNWDWCRAYSMDEMGRLEVHQSRWQGETNNKKCYTAQSNFYIHLTNSDIRRTVKINRRSQKESGNTPQNVQLDSENKQLGSSEPISLRRSRRTITRQSDDRRKASMYQFEEN